MGDESQNKRIFIAAGLCFLVLMVWPLIFPQRKVKKTPAEKTPNTAVAADGAGSASAVATSTLAAVSKTATAAPSAGTTERVKASLFEFSGSVDIDGEVKPFDLATSNVGGGIEKFELPSYYERDKDNRATEDPISLTSPMSHRPENEAVYGQMAGLEFLKGTTFAVPKVPVYEVVSKTNNEVRYRYQTSGGVEIIREYTFDPKSFVIEMAVTVRNRTSTPQTHRLGIGSALRINPAMARGEGFFSKLLPPPDHLQALCFTDGGVEREAYETLQEHAKEKEKDEFTKGVQWAGVDRQYFTAAIISRDREVDRCSLSVDGELARAQMVLPTRTLAPGAEARHMFTAYLGVKKASLLTQVNANLEGAIDYTILGLNLAPICAALLWVLALFHSWTGSWGIAILGLTGLVKIIMFPLMHRQMKSMRVMGLLKPEIEKLKEKYPDDRQRQSEEMMRLYKDNNVSPMGGCLPTLLQMPIWFALYRSLWVSVDLYQQGFLWIGDLTTRDPLWILPVALVIAMFLQQLMMPSTMDAAQQKMMRYTMPLVFGLMMSALPAGLCIYILVNTLLTIVQQHFINKSIGPAPGTASAQGATA